MQKSPQETPNSSYKIYNAKVLKKTKHSVLDGFFPPLPDEKYSIIYADPPWHYNGKVQFDKSGNSDCNKDWQKDVFVSAASFKYPTIKTKELITLDLEKIAEKNSLLFMWTTNPHLQQAINLGSAWGFEYKTVAFVWNKMAHNPGQYTLSYCELCLLFKKGKIPTPRGTRNIKQLLNIARSAFVANASLSSCQRSRFLNSLVPMLESAICRLLNKGSYIPKSAVRLAFF